MKEYITKNRAKQFVCGHCNEVCSEEPCEPSDCDWMAFIDKEPAADVVSKDLYEQIKWERDVALAQLKDCGVSLGEKADVAKVVRCKDCKYYAAMITDTVSGNMEIAPWGICTQPWFNSDEYDVQENAYCSYGERTE